jgi:hypothetical protein
MRLAVARYYDAGKAEWQPLDIPERLVFGRLSANSRCLDAIVDELRISGTRRYRADFVTTRGMSLEADSDTLVLFGFDGNVEGVRGAGATPVKAKLLTK